jgi:hypothetical protein
MAVIVNHELIMKFINMIVPFTVRELVLLGLLLVTIVLLVYSIRKGLRANQELRQQYHILQRPPIDQNSVNRR